MADRGLIIRAHAKINLWLRVGAPRPDGFHELRTVYQTIAWHDLLAFTVRPGPATLSCSDPSVPADRRNLVWRAMEALWRYLGRAGDPEGVGVRLCKRLPSGAGLGGGSADAAAALLALDALWEARLPPPALAELAAAIGSDVPVFLVGGTAWGAGRGELVRPLPDAPRFAVVLVHPGVTISTPQAYAWLDADRARAGGGPPGETAVLEEGPEGWSGEVANDLEAPVMAHHPEVAAARDALREAGALHAGMSGSGSVVFGLFPSRAAASAAARRVRGWGHQVVVTRTLTRAEYARRVAPRACRWRTARID